MTPTLLALFLATMPAAGPALVEAACVQCHDARAIKAQHKTEDEWRRTVDEMVWRGAPLMPGEVDTIVKYLASPQPAVVADTVSLPRGRGRDLVMRACVNCHDVGVTTSQHKSRAEWHQSIERMVKLGAKLDADEVEIITNYLSRAFGPRR